MSVGKIDSRWAVNGQAIYVPSDASIEHDNIVSPDSGRMESGVMHITWIRGDVRKVIMTYKWLTGSELRTLVNLMQGKVFTFTFEDAGASKVMSGYTGKITYKQKNLSLYASEGGLYEDVKIDVVEM